ncbi:hypothetical protein NQ317_004433 [Molorchus minor]|uniref:Uncharacterized protein n=1 Tax=Molorchus minor TaxID=1323400 RepID=A0ABQ9JMQ2_9CUCU|nr:hypothetical protein NQ317_004433 [Molorchus minor]
MSGNFIQENASLLKNFHDEFGERAVSVLLDGEESEMIFIDHPSSEMSNDKLHGRIFSITFLSTITCILTLAFFISIITSSLGIVIIGSIFKPIFSVTRFIPIKPRKLGTLPILGPASEENLKPQLGFRTHLVYVATSEDRSLYRCGYGGHLPSTILLLFRAREAGYFVMTD